MYLFLHYLYEYISYFVVTKTIFLYCYFNLLYVLWRYKAEFFGLLLINNGLLLPYGSCSHLRPPSPLKENLNWYRTEQIYENKCLIRIGGLLRGVFG